MRCAAKIDKNADRDITERLLMSDARSFVLFEHFSFISLNMSYSITLEY